MFTSLQFLQAQTSVANRTVSDAQYCGTSTYYTVWIAPKSGSTLSSYNRVNWGTFTEYSNGTASFQGEVYNVNNTNTKWTVNVTFSGRTYSTPANSPKPHMCGSPGTSDWYYYTSFSGTLTGSGNLAGTQLSLTNTGPSFQVGTGANVADLLFGASGWYNYSVVSANNYYYSHYCGSSGDFNFRLSGTSLPPTCQNLTSAGCIGSNESVCGTSFNPTLINSLSLPSGGGIGTIEYVWLVTTDPATAAGTASNYSVISGATGSTYDPGSITQTTWYRRCARRQGCTTYPAETNWVKKELYPCPATCSNVTSGGTIGNNESICGTSFDPANIINVTSPSGGSGTLEYMWLLTTDPNTAAGTASNWTAISGASGATYDPGIISQTTWYRRCSRRTGCTGWNGESNWVKKEITGCQNVTNAGSIGSDESVCGTSLNPALIQSIALPSGGCASSAIEYVWLMTTDPGTPAGTSWNVTVVSGANGPTYDPGTITQTTWYRRCSRRAGCSSFDGESNWVKKELLNNCCPTISVLNPNPPSATIISGQTVSSICVNTTAVSGTSIRFLYFTSSQINPYTASGGTLISTVTPSGGSACANNISFPANNTGSNVSYYVYAILNPTPSDPACRPFQQFVITVTPGCSNVTSPGTIGYTQTNCGPFDPALIQSITLPSGGAGTIEYIWLQAAPQDTANSGAWGVISGATGASYDPGFISQSTCYRRCARRSGCTSYVGETHWVCKIVTPIPGTPTVTGNTTVCEGNTTTLTASGCNGGTLNWYTVATGGSPVSSSATFTTPVLNATTNYYVDCTVSGCTGARTMVTISVTPNPAAPSVTDGSRCGPGTVDLSASGCTGGQIKWFATPTSTNIINTGTAYTTVSLSVTTTYYVECHLNGCKSARVPVVATINAIPATPVLSATQPSCGVSTGSITVTSPSGGLFEYSFDNGATYQVSNSKSGLSSGVYQIVVRRISTGCISASSSATINPPLNVPATPVLSLIQPDCNNATGSITVTSPTASNYEYSFDNGVTYQSTPVLSGLAPGTYQVKIKDINSGCISVATAGVLNNIAPVPTPVVTVTQPSCSSATGSVTVTSPTGTGIVYSFDNGATYQSNPTKSGLVAGNYYVLAKNNNTGCISPANYVTINNSPIPSASASSSPVCAGESIQLNATASVASPGTITAYNWTGPNGYTSGMEDPVIASATVAMSGSYTVTVTTSAGCTATASVNVTVNALPSAPSVSVSQPNCTSGTGSITVTAPVSGVMYSFDNGVTFQTSATKTGLGAGSYDIVVKSNATGCVSLPTVAVINPQPGTPTVTAGSNSPICSGNTITLTANASIASGTITGYTWTGPNGFNSSLQNPTIPNATVAASGLYTVAVTTSAGCTGSDATSVTVNALPNSGINAGSTICALEGTLYQAINPQPGDTYNWSFGGFATPSSSTASSVTVTYSVGAVGTTQTATLVVTNAEGCVSTYTHNINVTQNVFANAGSDQTICQGANVTLGGSPAGPSGATYVWTPNLFLNNNMLANPTSTPPSTIIYTLTVTLNGCVRTDQVVASVNVNNNPDADAGADKDICQGGSVVIGGSPTSSQPSSTYLWSPATGLSATNIANPTANPSATTVYQVIVTNQFGCKDTDMVVVTVNLLPSTPSVAASQPTCTIATGTITVNSPLGSNFEYSFDGGSTYQASNVKSGLTAGTYQVIVRNVNTQCISSAVSETINAQPVNCLSVGDIVFNDENNNGVQDGSEAGVPGVTVNLYADANNDGTPDGPAIATTTTNANGEYIFSGLVSGTYIVGIIAPGGYASSSGTVGSATGPYEPGQDPDNNINNDDNGTTQSGNLILSGPITLTIGGEPTNDGDLDANTNLTVDFGIFQALSLGNLVWEDVNNDGLFNNAESGIANILVYLYTDNNLDNIPDGPAVATTTTNASGNYSFVYLTPGNYIVGVNGAGYMSSSGQNASETGPYEPAPDPDNDVNGDDNGNNQGVNPILLSSTVTLSVNGESVIDGDTDANTNLTVDFGLFHPAKIGNFVWNDLDRDGIQDPGEPGIPNVQVNLYDSSNNLIATTSTDANGYYLFANIIAGTYVVQFDPTSFPPGYAVSPQDATGDALDSDPNVTTGFTAPITLTYGQVNNDIDAGLNCPLPNATIASNSPVCIGGTITLTGTGGGSYLWSGPNGFSANSALASVPNASLANSGLYNLTVTNAVCGASVQLSTNVTVNPGPASGINGPASICALEDALFQSTNPQPGNTYSWNFGSLATPSSSNASSATIQYSAAAVGTTQTIYLTVSTANNCTETYSWAVNVTPAVFANGGPDKTICQGASTQIGGAPSGPSGATYVWTPNLFLNSNSVSNPMATPPSTITYTLTVTLNGCVRTDQITVNVDVNLNPIADAGQDKAICQGSATGVQIGGAPTSNQPGFISWSPATGLSNAFTANPVANPATTTTYQVIVNNNFGCPDTDYVVVTVNPLPSAPQFTVVNPTCTNATGTITVTSPAGNYEYSFDNGVTFQASATSPALASGTYQLKVKDLNTGCISNVSTAVIAPQPQNCLSIGNLVWEDTNNDGLLNGTETGKPGVTVYLYEDTNNDGTPDGGAIATTTTNASGNYLFGGLVPGTYIVGILTPSGYISSSGTNASASGPYETAPDPDNDINNDDNGTSNSATVILSQPVTLSTGGESVTDGDTDSNTNLTVDFGIYQPSSIGNFVWNDLDRDGVQDSGESGIPNVQVQLLDGSGNPILVGGNPVIVTTNASGTYTFNNLAPGSYSVQFLPASYPAGFGVSPQDATADNLDSDANTVTGVSSVVTIGSGQTYVDLDAGLNCILPNVDAGPDTTLTCTNATVVITGSSTTPGVTYSWTGPNGYMGGNTSTTVIIPGTYVLTVTSIGGCSSSDTVIVDIDQTPPTADAGPDQTLTCSVTSVTIGTAAVSGNSYSWNTGATTAQ
ncbi:MAG: hypothetical protein K1X92_05100, partial [Bacteroidia bacterium]|nr:hypothetical protein [Bacteroidia bacterium]